VPECDTYEFTITPSTALCLACGEVIPGPRHIDVGEVEFENAAYVAHLMYVNAQERAIVAHYQERHRLRYWLWMKTGWKRFLG
jgi:hypothetical protein